MSLTYITPYNCTDKNSYLYERAKFFLQESYVSDFSNRIFVDFSSSKEIADELEEIATSRGIKYIRLNKHGELYSSGVCRNVGAIEASTKFISFQDVDLFANDWVYKSIENRLKKYKYFNELELIPCLYLTEEFSKEYLELTDYEQSYTIQQAFLENNREILHMYAPASSCKLLDRKFYLMSGGMHKEFYGHGFEDFELHYRLCDMSKKFYRTHSSRSHDYMYDSLEYKGYRTFFSMFGRPLMDEGLYFVHLWHDNHVGTNYQKRNRINRGIFERLMTEYDNGKSRIAPLPNIHTEEKILVLGSKKSINVNSLKQVFVELGNFEFFDETLISDTESFKSNFVDNKYDRVFFFNPYGNEHRLSLYRICREENIPFYVFDRGALNNSWFIDPNGFNGDSDSYSRSKWDKELTEEQSLDIEEYIYNTFLCDDTLEKNGERIGCEFFREKYGMDNKKILFVPFQRPNDSVIKYFSGNVESVEDFSYSLRAIASKLSSEWVVVAKKHPLESTIQLPENVIELPESTHIYDCIQASDAVLLINSGVGLLSAMAKTPVYHFGKTYYSHDGIACEVTDIEDAVNKIKQGYSVDFEMVKKFVSHLVNNVYSFADTDYQEVKENNGSSRNVAMFSKFYKINVIDKFNIDFEWRNIPHPTNTRYYDYYRSYFVKPQNVTTPKPAIPVKKVVESKPTVNVNHNQSGNVSKIIPEKNTKKYGVKHKVKKILKDPLGVVKRKVFA